MVKQKKRKGRVVKQKKGDGRRDGGLVDMGGTGHEWIPSKILALIYKLLARMAL